MKKKSLLLSLLLIVFLGLTLTACKTKTKSSTTTTKKNPSSSLTESTKNTSSKNTTKSSSNTTKQTEKPTEKPTETTKVPAKKLQAPFLSLERSIVTITGSEEALKFKVYINDQVVEEELAQRAYAINITTPGTYLIYVIALGDNITTLDSDKSNTITYVVEEPPIETIELRAPSIVLNEAEGKVTWNTINNATSYEVYINGASAGDPITKTEFSLSNIFIEGTYKIKVKALGDGAFYTDSNFSNEVTYVLQNVTYDSLEVTGTLKKSTYIANVDTEIDLTGLVFKAVYSDGEPAVLDYMDLTVSEIDFTTAGEKTVTISYSEMGETHSTEITITVTIQKAVSGIEISVAPTAKTEYRVGDAELKLAGITITVKYNTGTQDTNIAVTKDMIDDSSYELDTIGLYHVKVTYAEKSNTFDIRVVEGDPTLDSLKVEGTLTKNTFNVNHVLELNDLSGISLSAIYSDNSKVPLTLSLEMVEYDFTELGERDITISYQTVSTKIIVTIIDYVTGIQVVSKSDNKYYYNGDPADGKFLIDNTIFKTWAVGDPTQLAISELSNVKFTSLTPGHREITFIFGEFETKQTYDLTYIITQASEWDMLNTYPNGYFELGNDIDFESNTSISKMIGLAPMIFNSSESDFYFDENGNGEASAQIGVAFTGKFDGKGYKLLNFKFRPESTHDVDAYGVGLFGFIGAGAIVTNFTLKGADIKGWQRFSFIAGMLEGTLNDVLIDEDCSIKSDGGAWASMSVVAFKRGAGIMNNVICLQTEATHNSGTKEVTLTGQSCEDDKITDSFVDLKYVTEIVSVQNVNIEVVQNQTIDLSSIILNVKYINGTTGTVNPTSYTGLDAGLLGTQTITFKYTSSHVTEPLTIDVTITVISGQKTLKITAKDESAIVYIPYNNGWPIDNIDWSEYVTATVGGSSYQVSELNAYSELSTIEQGVISVTFSGSAMTTDKVNLFVALEVDSKEAFMAISQIPYTRFVLTQDIDFEDEEIINIFGEEVTFTGELDGRGHKLLNLNLSGTNCAIFRNNSGKIMNLELYGKTYSEGYGAMLVLDNNGEIRNIYFEGESNVINGGPLVANNNRGGIVQNVVFYGNIINGCGIAKYNEGFISNVVIVYDKIPGEDVFAFVENQPGNSNFIERVSILEVEDNVAEVSEDLWNKVLSKSRIVLRGIRQYNQGDYSQADPHLDLNYMIDNDNDTFTWLPGSSMDLFATIQIDLGQAYDAKNIFISMDVNDYIKKYEILYAEHVNNWISVGEFETNEVIVEVNTKVRYIRIYKTLLEMGNLNYDVRIHSITLNKETTKSLSYGNIAKYEEDEDEGIANGHTDISYAIDDDPSTFVWFKAPVPSDENKPYVMLDLGSIKEVTSVVIEMAHADHMADYFHNSSLYYSKDGKVWTKVKDSTDNIVYHYFDSFIKARYFKIEYTGTESNGGDLIIREFKANLDLLLVGSKPYNTVRDTEPLTSILYATDNNTSTSLDLDLGSLSLNERTIIIDLHELKDISVIDLKTIAPWGNEIDHGFYVEESADGTTFEDLCGLIPAYESGIYHLDLGETINTRFIKIIFDTEHSLGLTEVSVYNATLSND